MFLSPIGNSQTIDENGDPLVGGTIETYLAGTSTPATTYTSEDGSTAQGPVITLNSLGLPTLGPIWIPPGQRLKFIFKTAAGVVLRTVDDISGVGDSSVTPGEWLAFSGVPTYVNAVSFSLQGDWRDLFQTYRRVYTQNTGGIVYSTIAASAFGGGVTTITLINDRGVLDAGLSAVYYSGLAAENTSLPGYPSQTNRIINGAFLINQRGVSGTVTLAAGAYGHDRWKAGADGCTYTFAASGSDLIITITAGTLVQVIEGFGVEGGIYCMSWFGTATGKIGGGALSASGVLSASLPGGVDVAVEFSTGTLSRVMVEPGTLPTAFERRPVGLEVALCKRYYQVLQCGFQGQVVSGTGYGATVNFPVEMRTAPTLAFLSDASVSNFSTGSLALTTSRSYACDYGKIANGTGAGTYSTLFTASAEL